MVKKKVSKSAKKKVKRVPKITFKEVKLDNKSRKGDYIYIKAINKKPKYYKKKEGLSKRDYVTAYELVTS